MLFFDPPRDNRPRTPPLAALPPFGGGGAPRAPVLLPVLPVLVLPPPPEDCLLIAADLARADTFIKRGLESTKVSQASSVSNDHRVSSCDDDDRSIKFRPGVLEGCMFVSHKLR